MPLSVDEVRAVFAELANGDGLGFFRHVAEDVDWTVMGTHALAGRYRSRAAFVQGTFARLGAALQSGAHLRATNILVSGDWAVVELEANAVARNGMPFDNRYCWLTRFAGGKIVEVRAYLDSALVQRVLDQNPA